MHPDGSLAVIANVQYPGVEEESVLFLLGIFFLIPKSSVLGSGKRRLCRLQAASRGTNVETPENPFASV
jgi:hypothetical protein